MDVFIYALMDPETSAVRYIGKALNAQKRFRAHLLERKVSHKNNWLKSLRAKGLEPVMVVVEVVKDSNDLDWQARESYWIAHFRALGEPLTNLDSGGIGGRKRAPETILKLRLDKLGKKQSPELIAARTKGLIGRKHSPETIEKLKAARRAWAALRPKAPPRVRPKVERKPISEETRERMRLAHLGKKQSPETIAARSRGMMGHKVSAEAREKLRLAHLGKPKPRKALIPAPEAPSLAV